MKRVNLIVENEEIRLTKEGVWLSNGQEITHASTIEFFNTHLVAEEGNFIISVGKESKPVSVEDTAYFVKSLRGNHSEGFTLILSDSTQEPLAPETLDYKPGRLTCKIKAGQFEAKFLKSAYNEILGKLDKSDGIHWIEIQGQKVLLDR